MQTLRSISTSCIFLSNGTKHEAVVTNLEIENSHIRGSQRGYQGPVGTQRAKRAIGEPMSPPSAATQTHRQKAEALANSNTSSIRDEFAFYEVECPTFTSRFPVK